MHVTFYEFFCGGGMGRAGLLLDDLVQCGVRQA